jgi:glycosyltransferase involved in cell wall biosynthesis
MPQTTNRTVAVVLEHRFCRTPDGTVWTQTTFPYAFWQRYLEVFDQVRVIARVQPVEQVPLDYKAATGPGVDFAEVPYYVGPRQYLQQIPRIRQAVQNAIGLEDAVILRVSSTLARWAVPLLQSRHQPFAAEVVADPYDVFAPGAMHHPLRWYFRDRYPRMLRHHCRKASIAAYVTQSALQQRYPCPQGMVGISDVDLPNSAIAPEPRVFQAGALPHPQRHLLFVGTLAQLYKAPQVLIEAVARCVQAGSNLTLTMVGDGQYRPMLEAQVQRLGLGDRVTFLGQVAGGEAVRQLMQAADIFVLPSFQEGLPRAMVEAMAQGLPCIGSRVGGVPELLADGDLVTPGRAVELAEKIYAIAANPELLTEMSARNWAKAHAYRDCLLQQQRRQFYHQVRQHTEAWLQQETILAKFS